MTTDEKIIFWQNHIQAWQDSGLSQPAYCKEHDLKFGNFSYWRTRLKKIRTKSKLLPVKLEAPVNATISLPGGIRIDVPLSSLAVALMAVQAGR